MAAAIARIISRVSGAEPEIETLKTIALLCGLGLFPISALRKLWLGFERRVFLTAASHTVSPILAAATLRAMAGDSESVTLRITVVGDIRCRDSAMRSISSIDATMPPVSSSRRRCFARRVIRVYDALCGAARC